MGLVPCPAMGAVDGAVAREQTHNAEYRLSAMQEAKHQAWVSSFLCHVSPVSPLKTTLSVCLHSFAC